MKVEDILWQLLNSILEMEYSPIIIGILAFYLIVWLLVLSWVWNDISERTETKGWKILAVVVVGILNVPGLLIYLLARPRYTLEELFWADLERRYLLYETADLDDCPNCGHMLRPGFANCPSCGEKVKVKCKGCEVFVDLDWEFCPFCGVEVEKPESKVDSVALKQAYKTKTIKEDSKKSAVQDSEVNEKSNKTVYDVVSESKEDKNSKEKEKDISENESSISDSKDKTESDTDNQLEEEQKEDQSGKPEEKSTEAQLIEKIEQTDKHVSKEKEQKPLQPEAPKEKKPVKWTRYVTRGVGAVSEGMVELRDITAGFFEKLGRRMDKRIQGLKKSIKGRKRKSKKNAEPEQSKKSKQSNRSKKSKQLKQSKGRKSKKNSKSTKSKKKSKAKNKKKSKKK